LGVYFYYENVFIKLTSNFNAMTKIVDIKAREILDSRGNPTVEVDVFSENNIGRAAVPSGASTGVHEAIELRDEDTERYKGKGVIKAVNNVNGVIKNEVMGMNPFKQEAIDRKMLGLDGSKNKGNLGANAILGVSIAVAKLAAKDEGLSLYKYFAKLAGREKANVMPIPMMNIVNGGTHSDAGLNIQEFMVVPMEAGSIKEAVRTGAEIFHTLKKILKAGGHVTAVGDEGGFAPHITTHEEVLETIMQAIDEAGHGGKVKIALDAAASEFFDNGQYTIGDSKLTSSELVDYYKLLVDKFPIFSIEDSHAEDDFEGFAMMERELGNRIQLVGDDLFVTNTERIQTGIDKKLANSVLIKLNQIGSITETIEAIDLAKNNNWTTVVSHRSGETEDTTIADLAVGLGTGQIKTGSLSRTDRVCKYNQLIRIEEELGDEAVYGN
jgi:enolase